MEGVSPTLSFLALLLGLSGNARDEANHQIAEVERNVGCPIPLIVSAPSKQEAWGDAFWSDTASAEEAADDPALPASGPGSDAITRQTAPTGMDLLTATAESDPCAPDQ